MRIFNGTNSQINLPLSGNIRISIAAKTPSKDFAPNSDFLALLVSTYDEKEVALIVGGPYELSMCSTIPAAAPLLVQSLDDAIARFSPQKSEIIVNKVSQEPAQVQEPKPEAPKPEEEKPVSQTVASPQTPVIPESDVVEESEEAPKAKGHRSSKKKD